jgi:hypothetical protein
MDIHKKDNRNSKDETKAYSICILIIRNFKE